MIEYDLDEARGILHVRPAEPLEQSDFWKLSGVVDPFLAREGDLTGLIVEARNFPGWASFGAMVAHVRFVRDHHRHIKKIAVVTDSALGDLAEHMVSHFVSAEIRHFEPKDIGVARQWILT